MLRVELKMTDGEVMELKSLNEVPKLLSDVFNNLK